MIHTLGRRFFSLRVDDTAWLITMEDHFPDDDSVGTAANSLGMDSDMM